MTVLEGNKKIHKKIYLDKYLDEYGKVDWGKTVGNYIHFEYENIKDELYIIRRDEIKKYLHIRYKEKEFKVNTTTIHYCNLLNILKPYLDTYRYKIGQNIKDDKRDFTITDRKKFTYVDKNGKNKINIMYKFKCNKCGFDCNNHYRMGEFKEEHWVSQSQINSGSKCGCCDNKIVVTGINDIATTTKWMIPIINDIHFCESNTDSCIRKVNDTCPKCGLTKKNKITVNDLKNNRVGCDYCGKSYSYPNKFMNNLLSQLNIKFEPEKRFDWCKFYNKFTNKESIGIYDFYIPSMNLIIEMDGKFHYEEINKNLQLLKENQFRDKEKDRLAKENGIEVIRINCNYDKKYKRLDIIKNNVLHSKLNEIFDLSSIDCSFIDKYGNLINELKIVCKL